MMCIRYCRDGTLFGGVFHDDNDLCNTYYLCIYVDMNVTVRVVHMYLQHANDIYLIMLLYIYIFLTHSCFYFFVFTGFYRLRIY